MQDKMQKEGEGRGEEKGHIRGLLKTIHLLPSYQEWQESGLVR